MDWSSFTPLSALLGGALIGSAAVALMAAAGRIAGVSGFASRLLPPYTDGALAERLAFVLGLVVAPLLFAGLVGAAPPSIALPPAAILVAGALVGFGSVWGNGCTSGHGVCGLSRLSLRSLVATATFMTTAMATVFVMRHVG
jgi:uncharacterized membrane protein YedE/YeeE